MHAFVTIASMIAIFAAHVVMMLELRPRATNDNKTETPSGEIL